MMHVIARLVLLTVAGLYAGIGMTRGFLLRDETAYKRWQWRGVLFFALAVLAYLWSVGWEG